MPSLYDDPRFLALLRRTPSPTPLPMEQDPQTDTGYGYSPGGFDDPLMALALSGGPALGGIPTPGSTIPGATGASNGYAGGGGFVPTGDPGSATEYGTPDRLLTKVGITGVPAAVRSLLRGARRTGVTPSALSEAVIGEGFRTRDEQAALYQRYLAGQGNLAAPPGSSMHEVGRAFDISTAWLDQNPQYRQWLTSHGWEFPVTGEPWHAEWQGPATMPRPVGGTPSPSPMPRTSGSAPPPTTMPLSTGGSSSGGSSRRTRKPPTYNEILAERLW